MERLTTNKSISDMSTYELAHNCMVVKDRQAWYRDFDREISLRDLIREIAYGNNIAIPVEDEEFDEEMHCCLQYDPADSVEGMLALLNMFAWAHADNSAKLKMYEDAEEQGLLLMLPCKVGDTVYVIGSLSEFGVTKEIELEVFECVVNRITLNYKYGNTMQMDCKNHSSFGWSMNMKKFNELVFLTKEDAEKALADMQCK